MLEGYLIKSHNLHLILSKIMYICRWIAGNGFGHPNTSRYFISNLMISYQKLHDN